MQPETCRALGVALCRRLIEEIGKQGFPEGSLPAYPVYDEAEFSLSKDPYTGQEGLTGVWKNAHGHRIGEIKLHGDGSFYAEYDVATLHPLHPGRWFVEAVVAWGRDELIRAEARLLPALGD